MLTLSHVSNFQSSSHICFFWVIFANSPLGHKVVLGSLSKGYLALFLRFPRSEVEDVQGSSCGMAALALF